jgi:hypothetical protein
VSFMEYLPNGTATEGIYWYSPSLGTMSGGFGTTTYVLQGSSLQVLPGTHVAQASCGNGQLLVDQQAVTSAPPNIASALLGATAGDGSACPISTCLDTFSSVPVH